MQQLSLPDISPQYAFEWIPACSVQPTTQCASHPPPRSPQVTLWLRFCVLTDLIIAIRGAKKAGRKGAGIRVNFFAGEGALFDDGGWVGGVDDGVLPQVLVHLGLQKLQVLAVRGSPAEAILVLNLPHRSTSGDPNSSLIQNAVLYIPLQFRRGEAEDGTEMLKCKSIALTHHEAMMMHESLC